MREILSVLVMACLSMFRFMLFPMELTRSITQTVLDIMQLRTLRLLRQRKERQAIALSLLPSGLMQITELFRI